MKCLVFIGMLGMVLSSCVSTQRAVFLLKKRNQLASVCEANYPVRDSIIYHEYKKVDTLYFVSDSIHIRDTFICRSDTVFLGKTVVCPGSKVIKSIVYRDSIVYRVDSAAVAIAKGEAAKAEAKTANIERSLQVWRRIALVSSFFLLLFLFVVLKL